MTPLSATLDLILILTSATAILYCWQLGRRLRSLHNLKTGVGEAIVNLSTAVKSSQDAGESIAQNAQDALNELNDVLAKIEENKQSAEDMIGMLDGQVHRAKSRVAQSMKGADTLSERLGTLTERARHELNALTKAVEIAGKVNTLTRDQALRRVRRANGKKVRAMGEESPIVNPPRPDLEANPFLRAVGER
ncbi:MAG: hypothetical protein AAF986_00715 [Pseudomonadota bacterium]